MKNIYEQVDDNKRKSFFVIAGFIAFITFAAYAMSVAFEFDISFAVMAFFFAGLGSFLSYYYSDKIILAMSNAKPASREEHFNFYTVAENLAIAAQLPMPKLYVIEDSAMNAFATGRDPNHAVVAATTGLLARLDRTELEGVVAHELSHIKNFDMRLMSIVTILVGMITLLADWLLRMSWYQRGGRSDRNSGQLQLVLMLAGFLLAFLAPIIANIIKLAISRRREFFADASAAMITKYPEGLARALEKLAGDREPLESANKATAHLYITNPLKNHHDAIGWFSGLFNTHPPIDQRISALRSY
jgi:heat shock protein HtpX